MMGALGWLYHVGVRLRHYLYDQNIFAQKKAQIPIVSIGNIMAGGSGKTQVALLAAELLGSDLRVAVLSRGYKGESENAQDPLLVIAEKHSAKRCGDEPWLLANRLPKAFIIVNKDRLKSATLAKKLGAQIALLDDGMQHRRLHRDYEIVVIDAHKPLDSYLPQGRLREDPRRLKRADLIFFIGTPSKESLQQISFFTKAPQVFAKIVCSALFQFNEEPLGSIEGKKVALFCGIGNPSRFLKTVEELGAEIVAAHFSADHSLIKEKKLFELALLAQKKGATLLLCTEKDKVKLKQMSLPLPIGWIRTRLEVVQNHHVWQQALSDIKELAIGS